ncbi:Aste57867_10659 [Aphanomyces stellatus]|uniref:Aste57867_10659 protein n=1 Tax=Aphanomyces stellatus TaxID=120398 RepID=A0A485KRJ1_9STRA|nr:hypothetical protein As57867_010619 [Aphanomyces stellatus]VFT87531.1 Aste57867_10659 [Aphanomyces stellatus]
MSKKTGRGTSWCPASIDLLLDINQDILPFGQNGCCKFESRFNRLGESQLFQVREADALKRKFLLLKNHGDTDCPEDVQRAKRIQRQIDLSVSVLSLGEEDEDADNGAGQTPPTQADEDVGRSGLPPMELNALSDTLKRASPDASAGLLSSLYR